MRWISYLGILALVLFSTCLGGCGPSGSAEHIAVPSVLGRYDNEKQKTDVDVYWDATYSMQGYTTIPEGNVYRSMPDTLEDVGHSMGTTKFFRFGETVQPLEGREHRKFSDPAYYNETITAIHTVIDAADTDHLSIIVTDLFESDADWSNVAQKIKEKYFANHMAAAIIGIKNPFNGDIFDVGFQGDSSKFNYNSGTDAAKYRPFYMLVLGQEGQVREFLQRWKTKSGKGNETQYLLLSENLMDSPADFSSMDIQDSTNLFGEEKTLLNDKRMKEFGVDQPDEPAKLTTSFVYKPAFDGCKVDLNKLKTHVDVCTLVDGTWQPSDAEGDGKLLLTPEPGQDGAFRLDLSFTPDKTLEKGRINLVYASVVPNYDGFDVPDWVRQWNMENTSGLGAANFDGSKTINFLHLVESLKDSALDAAKPVMANMALVISYE